MHAERRGFTLIELIAGLALAGVVFTSMLLLVEQLRDGRDRLLERARVDNRASNGAELMRVLIARAQAGGGIAELFAGTDASIQFQSWCEAPGGWIERCSARLFVERVDDSSFVRADLSTGERVTLFARHGHVVFRYFEAFAGRTRWVAVWRAGSTLPSAVAVITGRDTVVMTAGGRG